MSAVPIWGCEFVGAESLTVGTEFQLKCHGDIPVNWSNAGPLRVEWPSPELQYTLNILGSPVLNENSAEFTVTSYRAGDHNLEYFRILKGDAGFEVSKPSFKVQSVLKSGAEPPKPFESFGPYTLPFPTWILAAFGVVALLIVVLSVRSFRKWSQRRALREELRLHRTALSPLHQFFRDARAVKRTMDNAKSPSDLSAAAQMLNKEFRLYFVRKFEIPALKWADRLILADLKKQDRRLFDVSSEKLSTSLRELKQLIARPQVERKDIEQLYRICFETIEHVDQNAKGVKR